MIKALVTDYSSNKAREEVARMIEHDIRAAGIERKEIISVTRTVNNDDYTEIVILYEKVGGNAN